MGKLRLGWEALKALPAAGLMEYLYKLGGEKKGSKDSGWKDALDAAKKTYPAKTYRKIVAAIKAGQGKAEGGMAYARKKNMGLKMNKGGSVKSKGKSRGTGAAKRGTKFKGTF